MKKSLKSKSGEPSFEEALAELERTVGELEEGSLGLDEALARHARGVELLTRCRSLLDDAATRVSLLVGIDSSGLLQTVPFDPARQETPTFAAGELDEVEDDLTPF